MGPTEFPFPTAHLPHVFDNHVVDADLLRLSYMLYTAQVRWNTASSSLKVAEARFQEASTRDATFISRAHLCYDVFAQLQQQADDEAAMASPASSVSEYFSSKTESYLHPGDLEYARFSEAFAHMFPDAAGTSPIINAQPSIAPGLLYSPSSTSSLNLSSTPPPSYLNLTSAPIDAGPDGLVVEDGDEAAALGLAMFAYTRDAVDEKPGQFIEASGTLTTTAEEIAPSWVRPPQAISSSRRRRPRSYSSDSDQSQHSPARGEVADRESCLPSPDGSSEPGDDSEEDEGDEDEFVPGSSSGRNRTPSRGANKRRRKSSGGGEVAGDYEGRQRRGGDGEGDKSRRQPRAIAFDPHAVYEMNDRHLFFLITVSKFKTGTKFRMNENLLTVFQNLQNHPLANSSRDCVELFLRDGTSDDFTEGSSHRFSTAHDEQFLVTFTNSGPVVTRLSDASHAPASSNVSSSPQYSFTHFQPGSFTRSDIHQVGSIAWWRLQACVGTSKHRGMPGPSGEWTARYDANPKDRRPARVMSHFSNCRYRQDAGDPLGAFARSMLGIQRTSS
ncbi:hypothetical protein P7C70_g7948, partial [Phenoliferia sp. Uapishka_3]